MAQLTYGITLKSTFTDRTGKVLQQITKELVRPSQPVPFSEDSVTIKVPVPVGTEFEVTYCVDGEETVSYHGVVPVPPELQEKLGEALKRTNRKTSFISRRGDILNKIVPDWAFTVDVWQKLRIAPNGFVEIEVHVGKEGIGTPKFVAHSQFWVNVSN